MLDGMCVNTIVLISPMFRDSHAATGNDRAESTPDQKKKTPASESERPNCSNSQRARSDWTTKPPIYRFDQTGERSFSPGIPCCFCRPHHSGSISETKAWITRWGHDAIDRNRNSGLFEMVDQPPYPGTPRWVKISGVILGLLILLAAILMVSGIGGPHGPGRHLSPADTGNQTPPAGDRP